MARPKKPIDPQRVQDLASAGLSTEQIAAILEVDHRTVERRFAPIIKTGRQQACGRLQHKLFAEAMRGNTACLIFACKNMLGYADNPALAVTVNATAVAAQPAINADEFKARLTAARQFLETHKHELLHQSAIAPRAIEGDSAPEPGSHRG